MHEFPPGKYFIGDPCYALSEDIYENCWGGTGYDIGSIETPEGTFIVARTAYGDGMYEDDTGGRYPVDSGTIAIIPWVLCERFEGDENDANTWGKVMTFDDPGTFDEDDGMITIESEFTSVNIDTS